MFAKLDVICAKSSTDEVEMWKCCGLDLNPTVYGNLTILGQIGYFRYFLFQHTYHELGQILNRSFYDVPSSPAPYSVGGWLWRITYGYWLPLFDFDDNTVYYTN